MKKLITKYRLCKIHETRSNDDFTITLADEKNNNYDPNYRDEQEFSSTEEALKYAEEGHLDSWYERKWSDGCSFTILPVYRFVKEA